MAWEAVAAPGAGYSSSGKKRQTIPLGFCSRPAEGLIPGGDALVRSGAELPEGGPGAMRKAAIARSGSQPEKQPFCRTLQIEQNLRNAVDFRQARSSFQ